MSSYEPELSIVIPVLNEAGLLAGLLEGVGAQRGVEIEVIISDGGSRDGTADLARGLGRDCPFPVIVLEGESGRGGQLNRGAKAARGGCILFLHADSFFLTPHALRQGLDALAAATSREGRGERPTAGKFRLRFSRSVAARSFGYYFYESKAALLRRECTHGDQGFLLTRALFERAGPFDGSFPMLAETRLADRIHDLGGWILLPAEISTSARRFETEGLRERQTLNAIIMNFAAIGWQTFFQALPGLYPLQERAGRLPLPKVLRKIAHLLASVPVRQRLKLWYRTGAYVRDNAWQLAYALDTARNFRRGIPAGEGESSLLDLYDRRLDRLLDHPPGRFATALLVWLWFRVSCFGGACSDGNEA